MTTPSTEQILTMDEFTAEDLANLSEAERTALTEDLKGSDEQETPADDAAPEAATEAPDPAPKAEDQAAKPDATPDDQQAAQEAQAAQQAATQETPQPEAGADDGIDPLAAYREAQQAQAGVQAAEKALDKAVQDFEDLEISAEEFRKIQREQSAALAKHQRSLDRAAEQFEAAKRDWFARIDRLKEAYPALNERSHLTLFDDKLRQIESTRPDLTPQQRIDLAFDRYAEAVGIPARSAAQKAEAEPKKTEAPKPTPKPTPRKVEPPMTLAGVTSEADLDDPAGGEFAGIFAAIDSGEATKAEAAVASLTEEQFDRLSRQLSAREGT